MAEKRKTIRIAKKKVRVKSKKKVAPLSKQQSFHISKCDCWILSNRISLDQFKKQEVLNQQELEDFEL